MTLSSCTHEVGPFPPSRNAREARCATRNGQYLRADFPADGAVWVWSMDDAGKPINAAIDQGLVSYEFPCFGGGVNRGLVMCV